MDDPASSELEPLESARAQGVGVSVPLGSVGFKNTWVSVFLLKSRAAEILYSLLLTFFPLDLLAHIKFGQGCQ